jgi:hypothetical protein
MDEGFNPFQSPAGLPPSYHSSNGNADRSVPLYASGRARAVIAMVALGILAMLELAFIGLYTVEYGLLDRWQRGEHVSRAAFRVNGEEARAVWLADYVVFVVAVVAFLAWVHRVYRNCQWRPGIGPIWRPELSRRRGEMMVDEGRSEVKYGIGMSRRWQRSAAAA